MNTLRNGRRLAIGGGLLVPALMMVAMAVSRPAAADETVKVDMWDKPDWTQGIDVSTDSVKAGKVTFEITNASKTLGHEFLIVKTDMAADMFPLKDEGAKVDESKLEGIEEAGDVEKGEVISWTVDLTPGTYMLFCNEKGHFKAGMHTMLTVTP
jgi:uncharacterized cupredoxin-like copper-binding protein